MLLGTIEQSFIFAIMVLGVYISYKILDFPDMTTEGSFSLGGAVAVTLITKGVHPYWQPWQHWCRLFGRASDRNTLYPERLIKKTSR